MNRLALGDRLETIERRIACPAILEHFLAYQTSPLLCSVISIHPYVCTSCHPFSFLLHTSVFHHLFIASVLSDYTYIVLLAIMFSFSFSELTSTFSCLLYAFTPVFNHFFIFIFLSYIYAHLLRSYFSFPYFLVSTFRPILHINFSLLLSHVFQFCLTFLVLSCLL